MTFLKHVFGLVLLSQTQRGSQNLSWHDQTLRVTEQPGLEKQFCQLFLFQFSILRHPPPDLSLLISCSFFQSWLTSLFILLLPILSATLLAQDSEVQYCTCRDKEASGTISSHYSCKGNRATQYCRTMNGLKEKSSEADGHPQNLSPSHPDLFWGRKPFSHPTRRTSSGHG